MVNYEVCLDSLQCIPKAINSQVSRLFCIGLGSPMETTLILHSCASSPLSCFLTHLLISYSSLCCLAYFSVYCFGCNPCLFIFIFLECQMPTRKLFDKGTWPKTGQTGQSAHINHFEQLNMYMYMYIGARHDKTG